MKKKLAIRITLIFTLCITAAVSIGCMFHIHKVRPFSLVEYEYILADYDASYFQQYISSYHERPIEEAEAARLAAEEIWSAVYGDSAQSQKPYLVYYDDSTNVWLVHGSPDFWGHGGTAGLLIATDGTIHAIWHGK